MLGLVSSWIDRKVTARIQARVGPPFLQPFYDFVKLLGKETLIPAGANRMAFLLMPLVALAAMGLAATVLLGNVFWQNGLIGAWGFVGDVVVVLYLLVVPSAALVVGASSSNNPFASVGASRELKLLMSYELPMLLAVAAALTLASGAELRFTREAQRQVDERLGVKSVLVSREGKEGKLKAKQTELEWKKKYRDEIIVENFPEDAKRLMNLRQEIKKARSAASAGAQMAEEAELRGEEDGLIASAAKKAAELEKRAGSLKDEIRRLARAGDPAAVDRTIELKKLEKKIDILEDLPKLIASVRALPEEVEAYRQAWAGAPQPPPLAAKVPLRLRRILTVRRAGPMPDERLLLVDTVVDKVGDLYRTRDRGRKAVEERLKSGEIEVDETEKLRTEVARRNRELTSIDADAKRLGGVEDSASRLDGAALAGAVRGRSADRWASYLVLAVCVLVVLCCAQAKLGLVPFDCAEADTEIAGGVLIEYGGPLLAIWKLVKAMLLFTLPVFIGVVFLGGFRFYVPGGTFWEHAGQAAVSLAKYVLILVFFVLVRNTNPRVRVDQAMRFFLGPMAFLAFVALVLAVVVHWMSVG